MDPELEALVHEQSDKIAKSTVTVTLTQCRDPQAGFYYVNDHVFNLASHVRHDKEALAQQNKSIESSLKDMRATVNDVEELASLKGRFSASTLLNLNKLMTNVNRLD